MLTIVAGTVPDLMDILPGLLVLVLFIAGLTLLYTFILTLESDRKKQCIAAGLLFAGMLLFFTLPQSVPGMPSETEFVLVPLAALSLIPLSAIIPGVVWFWPGKRTGTMKTTLVCAVATFAAWGLAGQVLSAFAAPSRIFFPLSLLIATTDGIPMGISLIYLAVFLASAAVACLVYLLMRAAGSRGLPGWLKGWIRVREEKIDP